MVTKSKAAQKRGTVKVGKLKVSKETIKDLSASEAKRIKGGMAVTPQRQSPRPMTKTKA